MVFWLPENPSAFATGVDFAGVPSSPSEVVPKPVKLNSQTTFFFLLLVVADLSVLVPTKVELVLPPNPAFASFASLKGEVLAAKENPNPNLPVLLPLR